MKLSQLLVIKTFFVLISSQLLFNVSKANAAEEIKIIYSIFSRTIEVNSLKMFAEEAYSTKQLKKILKATGSPENNIRSVLNNYNNNLKYTSEKNNSKYDVIIGPLENTEANNLVSYFISKGYKETEILIE